MGFESHDALEVRREELHLHARMRERKILEELLKHGLRAIRSIRADEFEGSEGICAARPDLLDDLVQLVLQQITLGGI